MGLWSAYFASKLYLYFRGNLAFHALWNVMLMGYLSLPWWIRRRSIRIPLPLLILHGSVGSVLAFAVFWNDTFFPPFMASVSFLSDPGTRPSLDYALSFLGGLWNPWNALAIAAIFAISVAVVRKRLYASPFLLLLIAVPAIQSAKHSADPIDETVRAFYEGQREKSRIVRFEKAPAGAPPFDIVFLHVCSMSWDDLAHVNLDKDPFFGQFDVLLTNFNTVTAYSGPSMLRLLRAPCGQVPHLGLYRAAPEECSFMGGLAQAGYGLQTVFNSTGKLVSTMSDDGRRLAGAAPLTDLGSIPPQYLSFDRSPIYSDIGMLESWWKKRSSVSHEARAALYYDTISLHAGVHSPSDSDWARRDNLAWYRESTQKLFADFTKFFDELKRPGHDVLVVMVPEHGAALVGDPLQPRDLRDIPLPRITRVPVGFKFIEGTRASPPTVGQRRVEKPTSYQAIAYLVSEAIRRRSAPGIDPFSATTLAEVPETPFLSENEYSQVVLRNGEYFYQVKDRVWRQYKEANP